MRRPINLEPFEKVMRVVKSTVFQPEEYHALLQTGQITDKAMHGYLPFYRDLLADLNTRTNSLLEIGAYMGASAKLWLDVLPESDIHILDIYQNPDLAGPRRIRELGAVPITCPQQETAELYKKVTDMYSIIIDDGSHVSEHMVQSFNHLFLNNLESGGVYVVEDLHCNTNPFYYENPETKYEDTLLYWAKKDELETAPILEADVRKNIDRYMLVAEDKMLIVWKTH